MKTLQQNPHPNGGVRVIPTCIFLIFCSLTPQLARANFTNVPIPGVLGAFGSSVAWGDHDNDGRLDFLLTGVIGQMFPVVTSQLWRNTGSGFSQVSPGSPGVYDGSVAWADFDNDNRLDFVITGSTFSAGPISQVWRNTGSGFTQLPITGLTGVYSGSLACGDYDNDGRLDILISGYNAGGQSVSELWHNLGGGFSSVPIPGLPDVAVGSVAWADYDNDGWLDFLITGDEGTNRISQLWRNTGTTFTNVPIPGLPGVAYSSVAWGDYDNDGRRDFLLTGYNATFVPLAQLWRNTGGGFTNVPIPGLQGVSDGDAAWGDYDNDGRLDFLLVGVNASSTPVAELWRNTGSGFTNVPVPGLPAVQSASVVWGDYDNDGRLDFLLCGDNGSVRICQLWRNTTPASNAPPAAPGGLAMSLVSPYVALSWDSVSDSETPSSGLTYNVRIGTSPGGADALASMSLASGRRLLPQSGNAQHRRTALFRPLPGANYYWSVQAVDTAFAGSAFSAEGHFTTAIVFATTNGTAVIGDVNGDGTVDGGELNIVRSNYFLHSPWLQMTNAAGLGATNVTFALTNDLAGAFSVEYTTNLADWLFLGPATPRYEFTDTNAPAVPQRYYRLRWP